MYFSNGFVFWGYKKRFRPFLKLFTLFGLVEKNSFFVRVSLLKNWKKKEWLKSKDINSLLGREHSLGDLLYNDLVFDKEIITVF